MPCRAPFRNQTAQQLAVPSRVEFVLLALVPQDSGKRIRCHAADHRLVQRVRPALGERRDWRRPWARAEHRVNLRLRIIRVFLLDGGDVGVPLVEHLLPGVLRGEHLLIRLAGNRVTICL